MESQNISDNLEKALVFHQEDYTRKEKIIFMKAQIGVSLIMLLLSVGSATTSYLINNIDHRSPALICAVIHSIVIFVSLLSLIWAVISLRKLQNTEDIWGENTETSLGRTIFILSTILFFATLSLSIIFIVCRDYSFGYFSAVSQSPAALNELMTQYKLYEIIHMCLSFSNLIFIAYTVFSSYALTGTPNTFRLTLYILGILQVLLALYLVYLCRRVIQFEDLSSLKGKIEFGVVKILMVIALAAVILTIVAFIINLRKWRVAYLVIGSFLLVTIVLAIGCEGRIYRNSLKLNKHYSESCKENLINIPEETLIYNGCPRKYLSVRSSPYLTCPKSEQTIYWEQNDMNQVGPLVCLNLKCCSVVSRTYQIWVMRLALANLCKLKHL